MYFSHFLIVITHILYHPMLVIYVCIMVDMVSINLYVFFIMVFHILILVDDHHIPVSLSKNVGLSICLLLYLTLFKYYNYIDSIIIIFVINANSILL